MRHHKGRTRTCARCKKTKNEAAFGGAYHTACVLCRTGGGRHAQTERERALPAEQLAAFVQPTPEEAAAVERAVQRMIGAEEGSPDAVLSAVAPGLRRWAQLASLTCQYASEIQAASEAAATVHAQRAAAARRARAVLAQERAS